MCRGNPHQGIPSTTVTASHVTQGRAEYELRIYKTRRYGQGVGFMGGMWQCYCYIVYSVLHGVPTNALFYNLYSLLHSYYMFRRYFPAIFMELSIFLKIYDNKMCIAVGDQTIYL